MKNGKNTNKIGETRIMKNGLQASIIAYRNYNDIDIEFEDGVIRTNVRYSSFKNDHIDHPLYPCPRKTKSKSRIGEVRTMKNGLKATIIDYQNSERMVIQFEDGEVVKGKPYHSFVIGEIRHPGVSKPNNKAKVERIGEMRTMSNGMTAKIIAYRSAIDIDVQFSDGKIREHVTYYNFAHECIGYTEIRKHRKSKPAKTDRLGETRTMNNGMKATIIAYRNYHDIDIQFEDGVIREKIHYRNFSKGEIKHPNVSLPQHTPHTEHIGETRTMNNGLKATIIAYRTMKDMDIEFEDKTICKNVHYSAFKLGKLAHPSIKTPRQPYKIKKKTSRIGETRTMNNGMEATIIEYRNCDDIDVQFTDGYIREHISYVCFKNGCIRNPNIMNLRK